MTTEFHYPPELFELLVEAIARLVRSKKGVVLFFKGAGVAQDDLAEVSGIVEKNPDSISKFKIVRNVLEKVNTRGDNGIRPRREIVKRVVDFDNFDACWPEDLLKAKGLVASIREVVNAKDSFTRMKQERDNEREKVVAKQREEQAKINKKRTDIEEIYRRMSGLFAMNAKPQERGKLLEKVLNDLFKLYEIHVREDLKRTQPDSSVVLEQIDGVIEISGMNYLVEMKWLNSPVGVADFHSHLSRLFLRANVGGIFISASEFTQPVLSTCAEALGQKTMVLCSLREIILLLQRQDDLLEFFKRKINAAVIEKKPYFEILG